MLVLCHWDSDSLVRSRVSGSGGTGVSLYGDSLDTMISRARILDKEGNSEKAVAEYRAILLSGYQLPADLKRYIKGRLALEGAKSKGQM